jgi:hypothetical protein
MAPLTFLQTLKTEVGRMQAMHPEREGDLARAHALILQGMVMPTEDPTTAHVLSSDGVKHYEVNGSCTCQAGQHGRDCKHMHAWKLYRYIAGKVEGQTPPDQDYRGNLETPTLPEAPASVNVRVLMAGHEVQWTLRGHDEAQVYARLQALLTRQDVKVIPRPAPKAGNGKGRQFQGR